VAGGISVLSPHNAQAAAVRADLPGLLKVADTVEKLQVRSSCWPASCFRLA
jgi:hypothetical protein